MKHWGFCDGHPQICFLQVHIEWNAAKYLYSLQSGCVTWHPNIVIEDHYQFLIIYLLRKNRERFPAIPALIFQTPLTKSILEILFHHLHRIHRLDSWLTKQKRKFSKDLEEMLMLIKSLLSGLITAIHYSLLFWTDVLNYSWYRALEYCW